MVPAYAWVEAELRCPLCSTSIGDLAWFIWGAVRSQDQASGPTYRIGDQVMWFAEANGSIPSDAVFPDGRCSNVAAPTPGTVEVWDERGVPSRCAGCDAALAGSVVTLVDGRVDAVRVVTEWPDGVHARRVSDTGEVVLEGDGFLRTLRDP